MWCRCGHVTLQICRERNPDRKAGARAQDVEEVDELKWLHHEMHFKIYCVRTVQTKSKWMKPQRCGQLIYVYYVCHPGANAAGARAQDVEEVDEFLPTRLRGHVLPPPQPYARNFLICCYCF